MHKETYTLPFADKQIQIELNDWMSHAESSAVARLGDTVVMVAVSLGGESNKDYFPLKVEYQERHYARGEILGGQYYKREGKPSEEAMLTARVVDRAIRPYFPKDFTREVMVVVTVLSLGEYDPDIVALNATALALERSSIPWDGPVLGARFLKTVSGNLVFNASYKERALGGSEGVVAVHKDRVCMLEVEGAEINEADLLDCIERTVEVINSAKQAYADIASKNPKQKLPAKQDQLQDVSTIAREMINDKLPGSFSEAFNDEFKKPLLKAFKERALQTKPDVTDIDVYRVFDTQYREVVRQEILNGKRSDGRGTDELRTLFADYGILPTQVHGSGLFYRGSTHVLGALTVGYADDALMINEMEIHEQKSFFLHYNFPPYSVGEVGNIRSPGRREIGHGALAEKAIRKILPRQEDFPYTIRIVCEVLSSNGSTSMASVCAASLALFDAGIPVKGHIAGIAMGMVEGDQGDYVILTDILGKEDHYGDMDFKIAGTINGITAIQLDCKNSGLTNQMIQETFEKSKTARTKILETLSDKISYPKPLTSKVEKTEKVQIPVAKIGLVIGKAGVTIKEIIKTSGVKIDIKQDGTALIIGPATGIALARERILSIIGVAPETPKL